MSVLSTDFRRPFYSRLLPELLHSETAGAEPSAVWVKWRSDFTLLALLCAEMERPVGEWAFEDVGVVGVQASLARVGIMLAGDSQRVPSRSRVSLYSRAAEVNQE